MDAAIRVEHLSKRFGRLEVLRDVSCAVAEGEVVCIIGPSGSGKSTLLRCMNGLEDASSGQVFVHGVAVHDRATDLDTVRREVGMVFQRFNLFPHKTVLENITLAPGLLRGLTAAEARERAEALLAKVGVLEKRDAWPNSSRAASSSAWRSPGRSPCSRRSCSSTNPPPRSIPRWWARCWP